MDEPLDERYFVWLTDQVVLNRIKNSKRTYWTLLRHLFTREFTWHVPNDDNRVADGVELRREFLRETNSVGDTAWLDMGCSCLEMLIALARRLEFQTDRPAKDWFWRLLDNLELGGSDFDPMSHREVDHILSTMMDRTYSYNGKGGLFPLDEPARDQRKVEIWYQMSEYLFEEM